MSSGRREQMRLLAVHIAACMNSEERLDVNEFLERGEMAPYRRPSVPMGPTYAAALQRAYEFRKRMDRGELN